MQLCEERENIYPDAEGKRKEDRRERGRERKIDGIKYSQRAFVRCRAQSAFPALAVLLSLYGGVLGWAVPRCLCKTRAYR